MGVDLVVCSSFEVCPIAYSEELTYWGISELFVEPCCQELYYGRKDMMKKVGKLSKKEKSKTELDNIITMIC